MGIARVLHLVAFEAAFHLFLAECKRQATDTIELYYRQENEWDIIEKIIWRHGRAYARALVGSILPAHALQRPWDGPDITSTISLARRERHRFLHMANESVAGMLTT